MAGKAAQTDQPAEHNDTRQEGVGPTYRAGLGPEARGTAFLPEVAVDPAEATEELRVALTGPHKASKGQATAAVAALRQSTCKSFWNKECIILGFKGLS